METDQFIALLVSRLTPVKPLAKPVIRLTRWIAASVPVVGLIVAIFGFRPDLASKLSEPRYFTQELAAVATALAACAAALSSSIPGSPRWKIALPMLPFLVWLTSIGRQCVVELSAAPARDHSLVVDPVCLPAIAMIALVPAVVLTVMIRRGSNPHPRVAVLLGGLAAGSLADAGLRLFHARDAGLAVLFWQIGSVCILSGLCACFGRRIIPRARVTFSDLSVDELLARRFRGRV